MSLIRLPNEVSKTVHQRFAEEYPEFQTLGLELIPQGVAGSWSDKLSSYFYFWTFVAGYRISPLVILPLRLRLEKELETLLPVITSEVSRNYLLHGTIQRLVKKAHEYEQNRIPYAAVRRFNLARTDGITAYISVGDCADVIGISDEVGSIGAIRQRAPESTGSGASETAIVMVTATYVRNDIAKTQILCLGIHK